MILESGSSPSRKRAARAMDGAMMLLIVLLIVQIWLLMASVESWLAGHRDVVLPAAIMSGVLFCGCLGLVILANRTGGSGEPARTDRPAPPASSA